MKQCGRRKLVEITTPRTLREFIAERERSSPRTPGAASHFQQVLLLFSEKGGMAVTDALAEIPSHCPVSALIGPEGGWSDDEMETLNDCGCKAVTLGPRVLRTETAALVAITLIQHAMGDLSPRGAE
jgi:16S rRNA (uracil1498-N3)-methyltransferase